MFKVCFMPTVSAMNYELVLTVTTKPMDQYFCLELWVESRSIQVVGVIEQQSVRCSAAI